MESVREAWTDERLDDLIERMDRGFDRVDKDLRELRAEIAGQRGETQGEINGLRNQMNARFESLERSMMQAVVALSVGMLAGFGGLAGLIATQL